MHTQLIFIRHAQSTWNAAHRWQGHSNPPLTDEGRRQAQLLARRLAGWEIDYLYASDFSRAAETATILGTALGLQPVIDPLWRERKFGAIEGLTSAEIAAQFPQAWASRLLGPISGVDGSEPQDEFMTRSKRACDRILDNHRGKTVAVVTHGGMILTTLVRLLALPPSSHNLLYVGSNTAISRVIVEDGRAQLMALNDAAHLELLNV